MAVKALDTRYNGYKFRSRLEARWAVFFDTAGIEYLYESEEFDLGDGIRYLPDFFLKQGIRFLGEEKPRRNVWVEIASAAELTEGERQKVVRFVNETGKNILLIAGEPGTEADVLFIERDEESNLEAADAAFMELGDGRAGLVSEREIAQLERSEDLALIERRTRTDLLAVAYKAARETSFDRNMKRCQRCGRDYQPKNRLSRLCYACDRRASASNGRQASSNRPLLGEVSLAGQRILALLSPEQRRIAVSMVIVAVFGLIAWSACQVADLPDTMLGMLRGEVQPTPTPPLPATYTPVPTPAVTMEGLVPGIVGTRSVCSCTADAYECADFASQEEAQACFDFCRTFIGDVHRLDDDGDGLVCVSAP